ncbi:hypothetical protein MNBD_NITROSPINAE02-2121 [hydrothermal vent metagenome]|uniref:Glycoside hydrolase family 5 domain-containing protein n=1 Tax=hydrothermal vent metagenome TaxID=652676 RepID=A0A3B1CXZ6_9ZZZZ
MRRNIYSFLIVAGFVLALGSCSADITTGETTSEAGNIPYSKIGINAFPRNLTAGNAAGQMNDIKSLGINYIRINLWFDNFYMASAGSNPSFVKFDQAISAAESAGLDILAILHPIPTWLRGQGGWKSTYLNSYVKPVVSRYKGRVKSWEIWNEPDNVDSRFGVLDGSADNYFELLKETSAVIRNIDPSGVIVAASAMSIVLDGLSKLNWTKRLIDLGLANYADILNIHYYSDLDVELGTVVKATVAQSGMRVWVTETGKKGHAGQLSYFSSIMPYINISLNPERIYLYCYVEGAIQNQTVPPDTTYGLLTMYGGVRSESSLYTHLKNR